MDGIEISFDDDFSVSLEDLLKSPIPNFFDDNQLFGNSFYQNSNVSSSCGNVAPSQAYFPSLDATKEEQQTKVGDLEGSLGDIAPNLNINEPWQQTQIPAMTTSTNVIINNDDQENNEYEYTLDDLFELAESFSPHPQQNVINSIYNDEEQFLPPMPPTILTEYSNMNACMGGLCQEGMGLSGILPMPMPSSNLRPTTVLMPPSKTHYQNNTKRPYNMQDTFHQYGYKPTNLMMLQNRHPQQQRPNNNFSTALCGVTTSLVPDISTHQTSTLKEGCISAQEKNKMIERYKYKRKRRDFSKKIKYTCRKTLADSRPRVRGRFAKNDETKHMANTSTSNHDSNNVEAGINYEDLFECFNFLDQSNCNNILELEHDPL